MASNRNQKSKKINIMKHDTTRRDTKITTFRLILWPWEPYLSKTISTHVNGIEQESEK